MHRTRLLPVLAGLLLLTGCAQKPAPQAASRDLFAMDTYMTLKVWCDDGDAANAEAAARIEALEAAFSVTRPESDIARVNAAGGAPVTVGEDTANVIAAGLAMGAKTSGALDITVYPVLRAWGFTTDTMHVPEEAEIASLLADVDYTRVTLDGQTVTVPAPQEIDLGALAKGYTSDAVMDIYRAHGAQSAIVSLGGNVQALGTKPDGSLWKVGILDPFHPDQDLCVLEVADRAVITSGNYERYFEEDGTRYWHILDPADGHPADNGLVSVTVVGEQGLKCDALSTALFVEGTEGAVDHWRRDGSFELVLVTDDARVLITEGLEDCFTAVAGYPVEVVRRGD